jgi:hypothetical protein
VVRYPHCERANARNVAVRRRQPYLGRKFTALAIETHPIHHQLALSFGLVIHTLTRREGKRQCVPYSSCWGFRKFCHLLTCSFLRPCQWQRIYRLAGWHLLRSRVRSGRLLIPTCDARRKDTLIPTRRHFQEVLLRTIATASC